MSKAGATGHIWKHCDEGFDREEYRERNRVERLINRIKQLRRIATGYEKRAANYKVMLTLAANLLWLSSENRP